MRNVSNFTEEAEMSRNKASLPRTTQVAKAPNWTTLPHRPITEIQSDHRINAEIDVNGVGRVQVKPGYNINIDEIRYSYGN
jgi:hypothetical protein